HIVAVSGYNLTILVGFLQRRFTKNWRWGGLAGSLWIILGFVIIAGASASIMRAGIMSALFLLANYYGKRLNLVVCMAIVAVGMVGLQPASLLSDIGWQLSFLSLFGITLLAPKISRVLPAKPVILNDILSVTLAAQLATAGLVAYTFGQISLVAPLSNLLIMPFIPFLMLLGFVASVAGIIIPNSAYMIIGRPISWIILLQFDLFKYLASWKFSNVQLKNIPLQTISIYYLAVIVSMLAIRAENKALSEPENNDTIEIEAGMHATHQLQTLSKENSL
ncbi:ComEC/Rec2 family competence protein, partial [Candidatus Saccharibacteria bacterium]|nr:ComEC/Rec2 family competence protein [Candidatus Saccharibacteria bacterium]